MVLASENQKADHKARVELLIEQFEKLIDCSERDHAYHADRALNNLLRRWKEELPALDDYFHKAFRQVDVTDSGYTDMAFWNLLHSSKRFWEAFKKVQEV